MKKPYFAWVDAGTTFNATTHKVEDEIAVSIVISQEEGGFPTADVVIKGPQLKLLAANRKRWCMISEDVNGVAVFRFTGRVVGIPTDLTAEWVTLKFISEPDDYATQQHTVAQTLKTMEGYDPLLLDVTKRDDPNAILEFFSYRWHTGRDLVVSVSDILTGEDGLEVFTDREVPYENFQCTVGDQLPITQVNLTINAPWSQASTGTISFGPWNWKVFAGEGLLSGWPRPGAYVGGGWTVKESQIVDRAHNAEMWQCNFHLNITNKEKTHRFGDQMTVNISDSFPVGGRVGMAAIFNRTAQIGQINEDPDFHDIQPAFLKYNTFYVFQYDIVASLTLEWQAGRDRVERVRATLNSDIQEIITLSTTSRSASVDLNLDCADLALPIISYDYITGLPLASEPPPIIDPQKNTYFPGARGQQTIVAGLAQGRAILRAAARCVTAELDIPWERVVNITLRKSATYTERRVGTIQGKITKYVMTWDGRTGTMKGHITLGVAIGRGGAAFLSEGQGVYAAPGYMAPGYQYMANNFVGIGAIPDLTYTIPPAPTSDGGLVFPLKAEDVLLSLTISNTDDTSIDQVIAAAMTGAATSSSGNNNPENSVQYSGAQAAKASADGALQNLGDWFNMQLVAVDKQAFEASYALTTSKLAIETGIDMGDVSGAGAGGGTTSPGLPDPGGGPTPPSAPSIGSVDTVP